MSTDVPHGDLEMEEAAWDADRVRYVDESIAAANRGDVLTAAEHVPTREPGCVHPAAVPARPRRFRGSSQSRV